MPLSLRAKRRLLLLSILVGLVVVGGVAARQVLLWRQEESLRRSVSEGLAASREGDHARAMALLGSVLQAKRNDHEVIVALATSRLASPVDDGGHLGPAATLFARAAELREDDVESRRQLVRIYPKLGFLREALDASEEVLALDGSDREARETRIQILASLGRWSEAVEDCGVMIAEEPGVIQWKQLQLSLALASGTSPSEVLSLCESWPQNPHADGFDDLLKATLLQLDGRGEEARPLMEAAVQRGAADRERLEAMSSILVDLRREDLAWTMIESSIGRGQSSAESIEPVATRLAFRLSEGDKLETILDSLPEESEGRRNVLTRLALLELVGGTGGTARPWGDRLASTSPAPSSLAGLVLSVGGLLDEFDKTEFRRVMEAAERVDAESVLLLAASHLAMIMGDPSTALGLVVRAEQQDSTLLGGLLRVELLSQLGQFDQAIEESLDLLDRSPGNSFVVRVLCRAWTGAAILSPGLEEEVRDRTGFQSPLEASEVLVEAAGLDRYTGSILLAAAVRESRWDVVEDVVVEAIAAEPPSIDYLMSIWERLQAPAPELSARVLDRLRQVAPEHPMVIASQMPAGDIKALRNALPLEVESESIRRAAWMTLLDASGRIDEESFRQLAGEVVERHPDDPVLLNALISNPICWRSEALVSMIIDRLEPLFGGESSSLLVIKANRHLAFQSGDADEVNGLFARLSDLVRDQPDSLVASVTLLRMLASDPSSNPSTTINLGRRILARHPDARELYPFVIELMQDQGMLEEAETLLRQFERTDAAGVASARQRARQSFREGDMEQLVLTLTDLAGRSGRWVDQLELARAREAVADFVGAEMAYREAIKDPDASSEGFLGLAMLLAQQGRSAEAEALVSERAEGLTEARREMILGTLLLRAGDVNGSLARFRTAVELAPDDGEAWRLLATNLAVAGQDKAAVDAAIRGLRKLPDSEDLRGIVVGSALRDGTELQRLSGMANFEELPLVVQECLRLLERSLDPQTRSLSPDPAELRLARELCGRQTESLIAWRTAIAMHAATGDLAEARALATAASARFPSAAEPLEWQVRLAAGSGEIDEAIRLCRDWRRTAFPNAGPVDQLQAVLELGRRRADLALELLRPYAEQIAVEAGDEPGPYRALLGALIMTGNVREAMSLEGKRLAESSAAREVWTRLATLAPYESGLEAMSFLEAASPSGVSERAIMVGRWLEFHGRHPEGEGLARARAMLPREIPQPPDPDSRMMLVASAEVASALGDSDGMRRILETVIDSTPTASWTRAAGLSGLPLEEQQALFIDIEPALYARNNLAMLLVQQRRDLETALRLVDEVLVVLPGEPNLVDTRAQVLIAMGRLSEAEVELVKALQIRPLEPNFLLTAAEILAGSGRMEDAAQALNRVQDLVAQEPWPTRQLEERLRRLRELVQG